MAQRERSRSPLPGEENLQNPYASQGRWRHQESTAFANYVGELKPADARESHSASGTHDLASFINKSSRIERPADRPATSGNYQPVMEAARQAESQDHTHDAGQEERGRAQEVPADGKEIICGPLLNYRRMENGRWHGSVLIVVKGGGPRVLYQPSLVLRRVGAVGQVSSTQAPAQAGLDGSSEGRQFEAQRLYSDPRNTFWSFDINVDLEPTEVQFEYAVSVLLKVSHHVLQSVH